MAIGLRVIVPSRPNVAASYAIPVRRARTLLTASFRFRVAPDTLAVRLSVPTIRVRRGLSPPSHHSGTIPDWMVLAHHAPCLAHTKKPRTRKKSSGSPAVAVRTPPAKGRSSASGQVSWLVDRLTRRAFPPPERGSGKSSGFHHHIQLRGSEGFSPSSLFSRLSLMGFGGHPDVGLLVICSREHLTVSTQITVFQR
jgi:hypothetical protein